MARVTVRPAQRAGVVQTGPSEPGRPRPGPANRLVTKTGSVAGLRHHVAVWVGKCAASCYVAIRYWPSGLPVREHTHDVSSLESAGTARTRRGG